MTERKGTYKTGRSAGANLRPALYLAGVLALVAGGLFIGYNFLEATEIRQVEITGNHYAESGDVTAAMKLQLPVYADSVSLAEVLARVERVPHIRNAVAAVSPAGKLTVRVTERRPVAVLVTNPTLYHVDADGILLPYLPQKSEALPLVHGFSAGSPGDTLKSAAYQQVSRFLSALDKHDWAGSTISEIWYSQSEGIFALPHNGNTRVIFGKEYFDERVQNWAAFYAQITTRKSMDDFSSIDLRYRNQIVTL